MFNVIFGTISGPYKDADRQNQDACDFLQESDFTVIAVADGAGSLRNSHVGARLATSAAVDEAMNALMEGVSVEESLNRAISAARSCLHSREDRDEIGCTLVVGVICERNDHWGLGLVGDSFAVVSEDGKHTLIERESDSEFVNHTKLLTSSNHDPYYVLGEGRIDAMVVATDGLHHASVRQSEAVESFWTPLLSMASQGSVDLDEFLAYMNDKEKIDDDTTVVITTRV